MKSKDQGDTTLVITSPNATPDSRSIPITAPSSPDDKPTEIIAAPVAWKRLLMLGIDIAVLWRQSVFTDYCSPRLAELLLSETRFGAEDTES